MSHYVKRFHLENILKELERKIDIDDDEEIECVEIDSQIAYKCLYICMYLFIHFEKQLQT